MASPAGTDLNVTLDMDDFHKLQTQIIDLRTEVYDVGAKLHRSEAENSTILERCAQQEKEIQKLNKLMKFPGFHAITKSKSKKDMVEMLEENERLTQQMQRHEDDFKLQHEILVEEVSRLSSENEVLRDQITTAKTTSQNTEEYQRLQAENTVLQKTVDELKQKSNFISAPDSVDGVSLNNSANAYSVIENLQKNLVTDLRAMINSNQSNDTDVHFSNSSHIQTNDEGTIGITLPVKENNNKKNIDLKDRLEQYFSEVKELNVNGTSGNCNISEGSVVELETTIKENSMLRQQLSSVKESSRKEVQQLREEVAKWSEKAKKKQESFLKLQEEKEKMYGEYRNDVEAIKGAAAKSEQKFKNVIQSQEESLKVAQDGDRMEDLLSQLNCLRKENENLQEEVVPLREREVVDHTAKIVELEGRLNNFLTEKQSFVNQLEKLNADNAYLQNNIEVLNKEKEYLVKEVGRNSEVAERRKCLLDKNVVEHQQGIENHQKKLEEVKERHNNEMEQLVEQKNCEIEDVKSQITNQKKIRKELEDNNKKLKKDLEESGLGNLNLSEKMTSLEKKAGWLERTLSEEQATCKQQKESHERQITEMTTTFLSEKDEQETIYQTQLQDHEKSVKSLKGANQELEALVDKLKQAAKDYETEVQIGKKKNDQLIKDLKRQLNTERKRADQLSMKLQDFIQEVKVKQTYDEIFNPESLQMKIASSHKRQDSGSHMSNVSSVNENDDCIRSVKTSSPNESTTNLSMTGMPTNLSGLSDETMDLISRYADLQQEKWMLEEKVRHLEENGASMTDDLLQKSLIIQHYIMEQKHDTPPSIRKQLTFKDKMMDKLKHMGTEELTKEMHVKMQRILEETLAKNVQLQKDLDLLSEECHQLRKSSTS